MQKNHGIMQKSRGADFLSTGLVDRGRGAGKILLHRGRAEPLRGLDSKIYERAETLLETMDYT